MDSKSCKREIKDEDKILSKILLDMSNLPAKNEKEKEINDKLKEISSSLAK